MKFRPVNPVLSLSLPTKARLLHRRRDLFILFLNYSGMTAFSKLLFSWTIELWLSRGCIHHVCE